MLLETPDIASSGLSEAWAVWLPIALITLSVVAMWWVELRSRRFDLLAAKNIFLVAFCLHFVVWPAWVLLAGYETVGTVRITFTTARYQAAVYGLWCAFLGLLAFLAGYYGSALAWRGQTPSPASELRPHWKPFNYVIAALSLLSVISFIRLVTASGGLTDFLASTEQFRNFHLLGTGYLMWGMNLMYLAFVAAYIARLREKRGRFLAPALLAGSVAMGMLGAFRHMAVESFASWLVIRHYAARRVKLRAWMAAAAVAFLLLNGIYVMLRSARWDVGLALSRIAGLGDAVFYGIFSRFHGAESAARIVEGCDAIGFPGGRFLLTDLLAFPIPRFLWDDKPTSFGAAVNVTFFRESFTDPRQTGAAVSSLIGSLYFIGGLTAVLVGMLLIGALLAAGQYLVKRRQDLLGLGVYVQVYIFALFVNESLDLHFIRLVYRTLLWLTLLLLCTSRRRPAYPHQLYAFSPEGIRHRVWLQSQSYPAPFAHAKFYAPPAFPVRAARTHQKPSQDLDQLHH